MSYNSKIILCKGIKMDRDYKDVVDYTEEQMVNLCLDHKVVEASDFNFVRENRGQLNVPYSIDICLQANYMAFQNPDYSGKWFFAWVDEVHFVAPGTTKIMFTIDYWSTWFYKFNVGQCFIIREHVRDDIIGKHTYPENLEHGEYVYGGSKKYGLMSSPNDLCVVITSSIDFFKYTDESDRYVKQSTINGIFSGTGYFVFKEKQAGILDPDPASYFLEVANQKGMISAIQGVFMVPKILVNYDSIEWESPQTGLQTIFYKPLRDIPDVYTLPDLTFNKNYTPFEDFVPKNNKLYCYPYNFAVITNNSGTIGEFHYENFTDNLCTFAVKGAITPGCSIKAYPLNYKGIAEDQSASIQCGKFPICNFINDTYTNWLTQNSININGANVPLAIAKSIPSIATNTLSGNVDGATSSLINSVTSQFFTEYEHSFMTPQLSGNVNNGDVNASNGDVDYLGYNVRIKKEYAQKIDEFFTRFGYKVNRLATPYINVRPYWDYLQIAGNDDLGSGEMPQVAIDTINQCARNGVTIWHDHDNIGNYSLDNSAPIKE